MAANFVLTVTILLVGFMPTDVESTAREIRRDVHLSTYERPGDQRLSRSRRSSDTSGLPRYRPIYHLGVSATDVKDHHITTRHQSIHDSGASVIGTHPAALLHYGKSGSPHPVSAPAEEKHLVRLKRLRRSASSGVITEDHQPQNGVAKQIETKLSDLAASSANSRNEKDRTTSKGKSSSSPETAANHAGRVPNLHQRQHGNETLRNKPRNRDHGQSRIQTQRKDASGDGGLSEHADLIKTIKTFRRDRDREGMDTRGHGAGNGRRNKQKAWSTVKMDSVKPRQRQRKPMNLKSGRITSVDGHSHEDTEQVYSDRRRLANRVKGEQKHGGGIAGKDNRKQHLKTAESRLTGGRVHSASYEKAVLGSKTHDAIGAGGHRGKSGNHRQKFPELGNSEVVGHNVGGISKRPVLSQSRTRPSSTVEATSFSAHSGHHELTNVSPKKIVFVNANHQEQGRLPAKSLTTMLKRKRRSDPWKPAAEVAQNGGRRHRSISGSSAAKLRSSRNSLQYLPSRPKRSPVIGRTFVEKMDLVKREQLAVHRRLVAMNTKRSARKTKQK